MTHIIVHNYAPKRRRTRDMISVGTGPVQDQPSLGRITPGLGPQTQKTKDVPGSGPYTFETKTKQEGWGKSNHASQGVGDDNEGGIYYISWKRDSGQVRRVRVIAANETEAKQKSQRYLRSDERGMGGWQFQKAERP